jgi:hypothetical protein
MAAMNSDEPPARPLLTVEELALSRGERRLFDAVGFSLEPG